MVGHDVQHDAHLVLTRRGRQKLELLSPAQRVGQPPRIDDVVAVRGAGSCLKGWGHVDMGNPQVAQVGDQRAGGREAEVV